MNRTELIVVGGFLGAGKTTSILSMAKYFLKQGKKIGIVTNDQGSELVDTNFLKSNGFSVIEVAGGCFCCHLDEFMTKIQKMTQNDLPDIIIAEPVGSCTNLIASLFKPLDIKFMDKIALRPLSVVVDPKRLKKLMLEDSSGFNTEINYIFKKQLEEADIILLNKVDKVSKEEEDSLLEFLKDNYKGTEVISISAKEEKNIEKWVSNLCEMDHTSWKKIDLDYNIYGKGEASLAWMNLSCSLTKEKEFDINDLILCIMNKVKQLSKECNINIAHLKVYGISKKDWAKSSITNTSEEIENSKISESIADEWNLIINIRSECSKEELKKIVESAFYEKVNEMNLKVSDLNIECFKPKKPKPQYKISKTIGIPHRSAEQT